MTRQLAWVALVVALALAPRAMAQSPAGETADADRIAALARDGDIVLHKSQSAQSEALRAATGSDYTHVGIVFEREGVLQVIEAVEPVRWTPLDVWVARGEAGHAVLMRVDGLTGEQAADVRAEAEAFLGLHYDLLFAWTDDRMYCSELVYKAFERATGLQIGTLERFADMNLDAPAVRRLIDARTGGNLNVDEAIVTPVSVLRDDELRLVFANDPELGGD